MTDTFPALAPEFVDPPNLEKLAPARVSSHPPRFLLLYGSLRERSYSRFMAEEADRLLRSFGAETRIFDPRGLPQPDDAPVGHPKVTCSTTRTTVISFTPYHWRPRRCWKPTNCTS